MSLWRSLQQRVAMMIGRCIVSAVNDGSGIQGLQIRIMADETKDGVERMQDYGYTSHPHPGAEALAVFVGGNRDHGVVVAVDDRRYRLRSLARGEVALYDDRGQTVHLKRDGILVESPDAVTVQAPTVTVDAETIALAGGGPPVARVGDLVEITSGSSAGTYEIISGSDKVSAG